MYRVTLIEGDGIGPEVTGAVVRILDAAGAPIEWERVLAGQAAHAAVGNQLPDEVITSLRRNRVGLKEIGRAHV
jgi:isocitrate dehydrogenase (NAD+)